MKTYKQKTNRIKKMPKAKGDKKSTKIPLSFFVLANYSWTCASPESVDNIPGETPCFFFVNGVRCRCFLVRGGSLYLQPRIA